LDIPSRLLGTFCELAGNRDEFKLTFLLSKKQLIGLISNLFCFSFESRRKNHFKEEFVTRGGISLKESIRNYGK